MKVAIAGAGNVGQFIANDLALAGHEVLMIEQDPAVVSRSAPTLTGRQGEGGSIEWRTADACEVSSLREADLGSVDVVVAATGDDEDNLVISLLAKQEFAVPRVVARVNHPKNEWLFNENWGVDVSVSTPHLILALTEEALSVGSLVRLLQLEKGRARPCSSWSSRTRLPTDSASSVRARIRWGVDTATSTPHDWLKRPWFLGLLTLATTRGTANSCLASSEMTRLSSSSPVAATTTSA